MRVVDLTVRELVEWLTSEKFGFSYKKICIRLENRIPVAFGPVDEILEEYGDVPAVYAFRLTSSVLLISI